MTCSTNRLKWGNSRTAFTAAEDSGSVNIQCGHIGPRPAPFVFVFDFHGQAGLGRQSNVAAAPRLDAGFLASRDHKFVVTKRFSVPDAFIKIQDTSGLDSKLRIARKDPTAVLPRPGRPGRDRSSSPARRSSKKRLRHMLTTPRRVSSREAISSFDKPSAASKIIFAR